MRNRQRYLKRSICLAMLMGSTLPAAPTFAQEFTLEEVIVTARKREESVNDIPVAVTAMGGEQMEALRAFDPSDLAQYVPGMTVVGTVYTIRGVGFNTGLSTSTGTVGVAYDQATLPLPVMSRGMVFDTERVEVLKGPQGTLYGRNTTGGQVNYILNKPTDEFEASAMAEAGNYDSWGFEGYVSGPIVDDVLRGRLSVKTRKEDEGWQKAITGDRERGADDRSAARLMLDFTPTDNLQVNFLYSYWEDKSETTGAQNIDFNPEEPQFVLDNPNLPFDEVTNPFVPNWAQHPDRIASYNSERDSVRSPEYWESNPTKADWSFGGDPAFPNFELGSYNNNRGFDPETDIKQHMFDTKIEWDFSDNMTAILQTTYIDYESFVAGFGSSHPTTTERSPRSISDLETFQTEFRISGTAFDDRLTYQIGGMYADDDLFTIAGSHPPYATVLFPLRDGAAQLAGLKQANWDWISSPDFNPVIEAVLAPILGAGIGNGLGLGDAAADATLGLRPSDQDILDASLGFRQWDNFNDVESETKAIFIHGDYEINDEWAIEAGIRYTEVDASNRACTRDFEGNFNIHSTWNWLFYARDESFEVPPNIFGFIPSQDSIFGPNAPGPGECTVLEAGDQLDPTLVGNQPVDGRGRAHDLDEDNVAAKVAVNFRPTDDIMWYGSIAQGYKAGSFNTTSAFTSTQLEPVEQEKVLAYEAGFKWSATPTLHWNTSAYWYDYTDKQLAGTVPDPIFVTLTRIVNVDESEVYGVESDVTWAPNANWFFTANVAYLKTEITEYNGFDPSDGTPRDLSGGEFALSPEIQYTLMGSYNFDVSDNWNLRVSADYSYTSAQEAQLGSTNPLFGIDSYGLVGLNANLNSHDGLWEASFWVRNLNNTYYWSAVSSVLDSTSRSGIGEPRTFGVQVRRNF